MTITTDFITVNKGILQAGTPEAPYMHKLTFNLTGDRYDRGQPFYGTKVITCESCQLSLYSASSIPRWSLLSEPINPEDTSLSLQTYIEDEEQDRYIGKKIVVASTSADEEEAEERTITGASDGMIIVNEPFEYQHIST